MADPVSVNVDAFSTSELSANHLAGIIREVFPLTPAGIIRYLDLRKPIYLETARHGHFGRDGQGFTWEKTHRVADLRTAAAVAQTV